MARFHINKYGVPAPCRAKAGNCPLGGMDSHYDSKDEAQSHVDRINEKEHGILPSIESNKANKVGLESKLNRSFSKEYLEVLDRINNSGFDAYFVGGSLRDAALGIDIDDVDVTSSAKPEEIIELFSDHKTLPIGKEHGTIVLLYKDEEIEITTFRKDGEYTDGRRPDSVEFTSELSEDVKRRDFTINSLAYNEEDGLVDLVGGIDDINNRVIRAVGDPDKRFQEDPLRIMRGIRFSSKLGFDVEEETKAAIFRNKDLLKSVSVERLSSELDGLLMGDNSKEVLIEYSSVISTVVPEVESMIGFDQKNPNHLYDVYEHSAVVVENANDDVSHKLAALYHDIGKPETMTIGEDGIGHFYGHAEESDRIARDILTRMNYNNEVKDKVSALIIGHAKGISTKKFKIAKEIYNTNPDIFFEQLDFKRADDMGKDLTVMNRFKTFDKVEKIAKDYLADSPILSHKDLAIKPKDIAELGYKGQDMGLALKHMSNMVMSGHPNERERQISYFERNGLKQARQES